MAVPPQPIGILGGTGGIGYGLALRLAASGAAVVIGSRVPERAEEAAARVRALVPAADVAGRSNADAAATDGPVLLCVPFEAVESMLPALAQSRAGRLLIETVVPLRVHPDFAELLPVPGAASVGEWLHAALPGTRVVSAFKNVPAAALADLARPVTGDVFVCGEDAAARAAAAALVTRIPDLRPVDAGSVRNARHVEAITALLVGVNRGHRVRASIALTGLGDAAAAARFTGPGRPPSG
jgi:NADPH-dependent F420 reductase